MKSEDVVVSSRDIGLKVDLEAKANNSERQSDGTVDVDEPTKNLL